MYLLRKNNILSQKQFDFYKQSWDWLHYFFSFRLNCMFHVVFPYFHQYLKFLFFQRSKTQSCLRHLWGQTKLDLCLDLTVFQAIVSEVWSPEVFQHDHLFFFFSSHVLMWVWSKQNKNRLRSEFHVCVYIREFVDVRTITLSKMRCFRVVSTLSWCVSFYRGPHTCGPCGSGHVKLVAWNCFQMLFRLICGSWAFFKQYLFMCWCDGPGPLWCPDFLFFVNQVSPIYANRKQQFLISSFMSMKISETHSVSSTVSLMPPYESRFSGCWQKQQNSLNRSTEYKSIKPNKQMGLRTNKSSSFTVTNLMQCSDAVVSPQTF